MKKQEIFKAGDAPAMMQVTNDKTAKGGGCNSWIM
jgi:hypothetical protein